MEGGKEKNKVEKGEKGGESEFEIWLLLWDGGKKIEKELNWRKDDLKSN